MDKKNEHIILQQFARLWDNFPKGRIVPAESPDFILKINHKKAIGIELTELKGQDFINHTGRLVNPLYLIDHLKETIDAKQEKLILYRRKRLFQIWLLIHLAELRGTVSFNLKNKLDNLKLYSGFDRIFLLETRNDRVVEITN
ncbi:hypothetical protein [Mangrovibacterium sp.]|uniref:hypothetical protein n=1 Tax=Mangrovibacterium sp. TaxID=1961364 RepID=UPI0035633292